MTSLQKLWGLTAALLCAMLLGCGTSGEESETRPDRDSMSPAEYFDRTHQGMPTPSSGKYVSGSATDVENGAIHIKTEDGSAYEIEAKPNKGGYIYPETRRIK